MTKKKKELLHEHKLIIFGNYSNQIQAIKHFDNLQTSYRIMTSTLLLATYAAIGFILSSEVKTLPFDRLFAVVLICMISVATITTVWHLDLTFVERLMVSHFMEAIRLETKYDWLPSVHIHMMYGVDMKRGIDTLSRKVMFYIGCCESLILTIGFSGIYLVKDKDSIFSIAIAIGTLVSMLLYAKILKKVTGSFQKLSSIISTINENDRK